MGPDSIRLTIGIVIGWNREPAIGFKDLESTREDDGITQG